MGGSTGRSFGVDAAAVLVGALVDAMGTVDSDCALTESSCDIVSERFSVLLSGELAFWEVAISEPLSSKDVRDAVKDVIWRDSLAG